MSSWRETEWKMPRKGEVVTDPDGNIGVVLRSQGTFTERTVWVVDVKGDEMYANMPSEMFSRTDKQTTLDFHLKRLDLKGLRVGALCSYKNMDIPLQIIQMEWSFLRDNMIICLKDLRHFESDVFKTEDEEDLHVFDLNYPSLESILSGHDSGLKWRIIVSLAEKESPSWTNCGSPWEFMEKEDALDEIEIWKSRLTIRRVASVINGEWTVKFPCWTIESIIREEKVLTRVTKVEAANGSAGYFETSMHASLAMTIIDSSVIVKSLGISQDKFL